MTIIAFVGMDGSGKTTVAEHVIREIRKLGIGHVYYHGFYNPLLTPLLRFLSKLFLLLSRSLYNKELMYPMKEYSMKPLNRKIFTIFLTLWHFLVFMETLVFFLYCKFLKSHKKIVIFDRFWIDRYVYLKAFKRSNPFLEILYQKLYPLLIKPDVLVYMRTEPYIAYERKREEHPSYDVLFFRNLQREYDSFVSKLRSFHILEYNSTNKDPKDIAKDIARNIIVKNIDKFLPIVRANRTEYNLLSLINETNTKIEKIEMLQTELSAMRKCYDIVLQTIEKLSKENSIKFVVYKTHNLALKRIPRDVDILVMNEDKIKDFIKAFIFQLMKQRDSKLKIGVELQWDKPWETKISLSHFYKVEISSAITWFNYTFISNRLIFDGIEHILIENKYSIPTPSKHIDFLIRSVHAVFGDFHLRYDEYVHLLRLLNEVNRWDLIRMYNIAKKMCWHQAYLFFIEFLKKISKKERIERIKHGFTLPSFPIAIPYGLVIHFFAQLLLCNLKYRRLRIRAIVVILVNFIIHFFKNLSYRLIDFFFYTKTYRFVVR